LVPATLLNLRLNERHRAGVHVGAFLNRPNDQAFAILVTRPYFPLS
jgi:hypothetical protein